ncbi:MAG: transposase [Bacilli bacterium]|nr:transposase [Bacilli bacterium]
MSNTDKNSKIKATYLATLAKRENQRVRVFTVKVQMNKLNKEQKQHLKMLFVEAKWMKNHILNLQKNNSDIDVFSLKYTDLLTVTHLDKDKNEIVSQLSYLSSQMKQEVLTDIHSSIRALSKAKEKGCKVGALKFVSDYTSINLKQFNVSYKIVNGSKIKLQGLKKPIKVNGLDQLSALSNYEFANAKLIKKPSGYYFALTIYTDKVSPQPNKPLIGLDMGCQTSFTLSDGRKLNCLVEESEQLKRTHRRLNRCKKGSNNRWKLRKKLRKLYERDCNVKNNLANQLCSALKEYKVVIQDEQLRSWKVRHGKKVQHSILGRVKQRLMALQDTVVLDRFVPTTKFCRDCGEIHTDIKLWDRDFVCPSCGVTYDRDIHAAENMIWLYENIIGVERTEFKLVDFKASVNRYFKG